MLSVEQVHFELFANSVWLGLVLVEIWKFSADYLTSEPLTHVYLLYLFFELKNSICENNIISIWRDYNFSLSKEIISTRWIVIMFNDW